MSSAQETRDAKALRAKLAAGGLSKADAAESNSILRIWEAKREWNKVSNTMNFHRTFCAQCEAYHTVFVAFGENQKHKHNSTTRWVKVDAHKNPELPKEVLYTEETAPTCEDCAAKSDWPVEE
jgi:hypothetical protein